MVHGSAGCGAACLAERHGYDIHGNQVTHSWVSRGRAPYLAAGGLTFRLLFVTDCSHPFHGTHTFESYSLLHQLKDKTAEGFTNPLLFTAYAPIGQGVNENADSSAGWTGRITLSEGMAQTSELSGRRRMTNSKPGWLLSADEVIRIEREVRIMMRKKAALLLGMTLTMTGAVAGSGMITAYAESASTQTEASTDSASTESAQSTSSQEQVSESQDGSASSDSADGNTQQPPEKPDGDTSGGPGSSDGNGQQPPEKPDGDSSDGQGGPGGNGQGGPGGNGQAPDGQGGPGGNGQAPGGMGGANTQEYDYTGTLSGALTADGAEVSSDGETTTATEADQNAALAQNGGTLTITNGTLEKSGDDTNGDNCNFYGLNSIALSVGEQSLLKISGSTLTADSEGSNAIFATDNGTVYAYNDTITTTAGNSRGLDATYGGTVVADSMTITTNGDHCAATATDRGGGNISVTNSTLSTAGSGSPLLYSTGDIEVDNVTGTATGSQIAGMEGLNTILIYNSSLTSTLTGATASDPIADGIIIYQSTSGDAESTTGETATFQAVNSTLSSAIESGAMFYVTNTSANVLLSGTTLDFDSDAANLLQIEGNDSNNWGTAGSNGGTVTFTALGEELSGNISVDTISSLDLYLLDGTTYTGAMTITDNAVNTNATEAPITVNVGSDSKWIVTADTTISNLNVADGGQVVDADGNTVTIVANGETVVEGTSGLTVTVTGSYSTTVETGEDNQISTSYIDRSGFDTEYGTTTTFGENA